MAPPKKRPFRLSCWLCCITDSRVAAQTVGGICMFWCSMALVTLITGMTKLDIGGKGDGSDDAVTDDEIVKTMKAIWRPIVYMQYAFYGLWFVFSILMLFGTQEKAQSKGILLPWIFYSALLVLVCAGTLIVVLVNKDSLLNSPYTIGFFTALIFNVIFGVYGAFGVMNYYFDVRDTQHRMKIHNGRQSQNNKLLQSQEERRGGSSRSREGAPPSRYED